MSNKALEQEQETGAVIALRVRKSGPYQPALQSAPPPFVRWEALRLCYNLPLYKVQRDFAEQHNKVIPAHEKLPLATLLL